MSKTFPSNPIAIPKEKYITRQTCVRVDFKILENGNCFQDSPPEEWSRIITSDLLTDSKLAQLLHNMKLHVTRRAYIVSRACNEPWKTRGWEKSMSKAQPLPHYLCDNILARFLWFLKHFFHRTYEVEDLSFAIGDRGRIRFFFYDFVVFEERKVLLSRERR